MSNHIKALEAEVEYLRRLVRLAYAEGFEDGRYAAEDWRVPSDPKNPSERTEAMAKILAEFWEASESKKSLSPSALATDVERLQEENLVMRSICRDVVRYWEEDCPQVSMNDLADAARKFVDG